MWCLPGVVIAVVVVVDVGVVDVVAENSDITSTSVSILVGVVI